MPDSLHLLANVHMLLDQLVDNAGYWERRLRLRPNVKGKLTATPFSTAMAYPTVNGGNLG